MQGGKLAPSLNTRHHIFKRNSLAVEGAPVSARACSCLAGMTSKSHAQWRSEARCDDWGYFLLGVGLQQRSSLSVCSAESESKLVPFRPLVPGHCQLEEVSGVALNSGRYHPHCTSRRQGRPSELWLTRSTSCDTRQLWIPNLFLEHN